MEGFSPGAETPAGMAARFVEVRLREKSGPEPGF
jgi:hypothetical protein